MKPTSAHKTQHADDARMMDDDAKEQTEEGRSAVQAAPRAPIHAAASAEHKHSDSSSMAESKQQETATTEPSPAPSTGRSKRVREPQAEAAAAAAADPLAAPAAAASSSCRSSKQARTAAESSVQQQKADSASAKKKGSGRRGSRAEPEQRGEDEAAPEAAAAAASSASSTTKRTSAAAASSKSAASLKPTAGSAASARPSPFSRLDADSLGVALSCLDANEFLVARLVSKQWHAASAKRTAWPQLQVGAFIRLMQNDAYDEPSRRRLVVRSDDKLRSFVQRFTAHSSKDVFGKHASEVKFSMRVPCEASVFVERKALLQSALHILAAQFQFLSALTLDGCDLEKEAIKPLFKALRPLLRVLILSNCGRALYRQVVHLKQLRVLVIDTLPPAEALRSLVSLQYLHIRIPASRIRWSRDDLFDSNHCRVLRWLSVNHALRSLSIERRPPL